MIQIDAVTITEFRGIRSLTLKLDEKSFAVWGPNGSGKSGVVDAIDFALTGNISRLSGAGTGGLTVLKHGPHVHKRHDAGVCRVDLTVRDPETGERSVLSRTVKTAATYTLTPDTPGVRAAVEQARQHPELTLSRREIIQYVVAEAGKRAQEVQALLKLNRIGQIRQLLQSARTKTRARFAQTQGELTNAQEALLRHLDTSQYSLADLAERVNERRKILRLEPLTLLTPVTDLQAGVSDEVGNSAFDKATAVRDVQALLDWLSEPNRMSGATTELAEALAELDADPEILSALRHRTLVMSGINLLSAPACPLCDSTWPDIETLRAHLNSKLSRSEAAAKLQARIDAAATACRRELAVLRDLIRTVQSYANSDGDKQLQGELQAWTERLASLSTMISSTDSTVSHREQLGSDILEVPAVLEEHISKLCSTLVLQRRSWRVVGC